MTINVMVTGARDLYDVRAVERELELLCAEHVLVGDCPTGADLRAREWCKYHRVPCEVFRADWVRLGRRAGPMRNLRMVRRAVEFPPTFVIAFPRGGPGTKDCIAQARRSGLIVRER